MGKAGFEPARLAAHDPKSCSSANSDTPPYRLLCGRNSNIIPEACQFLGGCEHLHMQLNHITIVQNVVSFDHLPIKNILPPHFGKFQIFDKIFMDFDRKIINGAIF